MTIAIGFACDEGLLLCADTKVSTNVKTSESKIEVFRSDDRLCCMAFAMSGDDLNFPRAAVRMCWDYVKGMDFTTATMDAVRNAADFALEEFYRAHIYSHPDRTPGAVFLEILVGIWLHRETRLFVSHETLLMPVNEYECIGSGAYLAKYLIRQYQEANKNPKTLQDAAMIGSFSVQSAIDYDEHCGGRPETLTMRNAGDIDHGTELEFYPSDGLIKGLQQETWKLLHALTHIEKDKLQSETAVRFGEHFKAVQEANDFWLSWYEDCRKMLRRIAIRTDKSGAFPERSPQ